jgi:hypothetical protein
MWTKRDRKVQGEYLMPCHRSTAIANSDLYVQMLQERERNGEPAHRAIRRKVSISCPIIDLSIIRTHTYRRAQMLKTKSSSRSARKYSSL